MGRNDLGLAPARYGFLVDTGPGPECVGSLDESPKKTGSIRLLGIPVRLHSYPTRPSY